MRQVLRLAERPAGRGTRRPRARGYEVGCGSSLAFKHFPQRDAPQDHRQRRAKAPIRAQVADALERAGYLANP